MSFGPDRDEKQVLQKTTASDNSNSESLVAEDAVVSHERAVHNLEIGVTFQAD